MTGEEFVSACVKSGYASKSMAQCYSERKEAFTDTNLVEVYRMLLASTNAVFLANKNAIFYLYIYPGEKLPDLLL